MKIRKNNIERKQAGGIIYTPFLGSPISPYDTSANQATTDSGKIGDIQKEIMDVLQENGLPSDVDYFMNAATRFLHKAEATGNWSLSEFARIQSLANRVAYNKQAYDSAAKHLTETGTWNEIALNDKGQIYAQNIETKEMLVIDPSEYYHNRDKYIPLTNNDVLHYRSNAIPFDDQTLSSMSGSIGVDDIVDYIKGIVLDLSTRSISGYTNSEAAKLDESLNSLIANGPVGYYKFKQELQSGGGSTVDAINYLYAALPSNMRQFLRAKAAAENQNPDTHSVDLLVKMLANHLDTSISVDFDSAATKSAGIGADSDSQKRVERTLAERYVDGNGLGQHQYIELRPWDSNASLMVMGQSAQTIMDKDLKTPLPTTTLNQVFTQGYGIGVVTRKDSVSFGDQLLSPADYDRVVYDSSTPLYRVVMPYRVEGGRIVPDLALVDEANELQKTLQEQGITDPGYISELVNDRFNGRGIYNPETGTIDFKQQMAFLTFGAIVGGNNASFNKNSHWIHNLDRTEGKQLRDIYNNTINYGNTYGTGEAIADNSKTGKGNLYVGNIFIPIDNSLAGATIFNNDTAPASRYQDMTATAEANAYTRAVRQASQQPRTNF